MAEEKDEEFLNNLQNTVDQGFRQMVEAGRMTQFVQHAERIAYEEGRRDMMKIVVVLLVMVLVEFAAFVYMALR
jgi:hypothetical protein